MSAARETVQRRIEDLDRAVLDGSNVGFVRVHLKKGTDRILGATLVAEHAGDMIGELALAITATIAPMVALVPDQNAVSGEKPDHRDRADEQRRDDCRPVPAIAVHPCSPVQHQSHA